MMDHVANLITTQELLRHKSPNIALHSKVPDINPLLMELHVLDHKFSCQLPGPTQSIT